MFQPELPKVSLTPVASLLFKCVAHRALRQEEIDSALSDRSPAFSHHLSRAEQQMAARRELDQLQFQSEQLQFDRLMADVTHPFHLRARAQRLQTFCSHLQEVLREKAPLRLRLLQQDGDPHLPVDAPLRRFVVEVVQMFLDFIKALEKNVSLVHGTPNVPERLAKTNPSLSSLLVLVAEVQNLSIQILSLKEVSSSVRSDSSAPALLTFDPSPLTSDP